VTTRTQRLLMLALAFAAGPWSQTQVAFGQTEQSGTEASQPPQEQPRVKRSGVSRVSMPSTHRPRSGATVRVVPRTAPVATTSTRVVSNITPTPTPTPILNTNSPAAVTTTPSAPSPSVRYTITASNVAPPVEARSAPTSGVSRRSNSAPASIRLQAVEAGLSINWSDVANESRFVVQRMTLVSGVWTSLRETTVNANTLSSIDRPATGTYAYRVGAVVGNAKPGYSMWRVVNVTTQASQASNNGGIGSNPQPVVQGPPSVPTGIVLSDTGNRTARVAWTFPQGSSIVTNVTIERDPAFARPVVVSSGIASLVDASGPGTFSYRLRASGPGGTSAFSDWQQVSVRERTPFAASSLSAADMGDFENVRLTWVDASDNERSFIVQWQTLTGGDWSDRPSISVLANTTEQVISSGPGEHRFRVVAANEVGQSSPTDFATITIAAQPTPDGTQPGAPVSPADLRLTQSGGRQTLISWTDRSSDETGFELERTPAFPSGRVRVDANQTLYTDAARTGSTSYRVRAIGNAPSEFTDWMSITLQPTAPNAPNNVDAVDVGDGATVRLTWNDASDDESGFGVEHQLADTSNNWGPTRLIRLTANSTQLLDRPGPGMHRYRVVAMNDAGPGASPWVEVRVEALNNNAGNLPPAAPSNIVAVDQGNARAGVVWTDNSSNETGFEIRRVPALSTQTIVGTDVSAYVDASGAGTFQYSVRAINANGESPWSEWATVRVAEQPPQSPSDLRAIDQGNHQQVRITWNDTSDNEQGFRILRSEYVAGSWSAATILNVSRNVTSYLDTPGLGRFRYRVVAFNEGGENGTDWSTLGVTDGWTQLPDGPDIRKIYVSSSRGNDANDGLSPDRPKRTIFGGFQLLRDYSGDQLLLRRGDVWTGEHIGDRHGNELGGLNRSGASAERPLVIASYGDDPRRPLVKTGNAPFAINFQRQSGIDHVWMIGLHLQANTRMPGPEYVAENAQTETRAAIRFWLTGEDFLFEDMLIENYTGAIAVQSSGAAGELRNLRLRRCVIVDQFPAPTGHSSGVFISGVDGVLIDECVFDRNGWTDRIPGRESTIFNHNMYLEQSSTNVIVRNTISARASATGIQMRGRHMEAINNLLLDNPLGMVGGHLQAVEGQEWTGAMLDNVILGSGDIGVAPNIRPHGFGIMYGRGRGARIERNIIANNTTSYGLEPGLAVDRQLCLDMTVADNIIYNWMSGNPSGQKSAAMRVGHRTEPLDRSFVLRNNVLVQPNGGPLVHSTASRPGGTWSGNTYYSASPNDHALVVENFVNKQTWIGATQDATARTQAPNFPDASRSIETYMQSLGLSGGLNEFMMEARKQTHSNWRPEFTAQAVNAYMREGFGRPAQPGPLPGSSGQ
jgi:hypothetical protein